MENQEIASEVQRLAKDFESQRNTMAAVIDLLERISNAVNEGFQKVNERLSVLEGKQGMQGVNTQLIEIKNELHKIQKTYPYEEIFANIQTAQKIGEA